MLSFPIWTDTAMALARLPFTTSVTSESDITTPAIWISTALGTMMGSDVEISLPLILKVTNQIPLDECDSLFEDETCSPSCRSALSQTQRDFGCCLTTGLLIQTGVVEENPLILCGLEGSTDTCVSHFTEEPILPRPTYYGEPDCIVEEEALPQQCRDYVSLDAIRSRASIIPDEFQRDFCNGECGELVYNYYLQCDSVVGYNNAPTVDFICAQNSGTTCAGVYADPSVLTLYGTVCGDVSDTFCSDECSSALQQASNKWGCCLFTLGVLDNNVTYIEGIYTQCNVPADPQLCDGGFSSEPDRDRNDDEDDDTNGAISIDREGNDDEDDNTNELDRDRNDDENDNIDRDGNDDEDDNTSGVANTIVSPAMIVVALLTLTLTLY